ncbi:hypothetical protein PT2222_430013 [Paraburkholderia tropica]
MRKYRKKTDYSAAKNANARDRFIATSRRGLAAVLVVGFALKGRSAHAQCNTGEPAALQLARDGFADIRHFGVEFEIGVRVGRTRVVHRHALGVMPEFALEKIAHILFATGLGHIPDGQVHDGLPRAARTIRAHAHGLQARTSLRASPNRLTKQGRNSKQQQAGRKHFALSFY